MNKKDAKKTYGTAIERYKELVAELRKLKSIMDKAYAVYSKKVKELNKKGILPTGGYIAKGEEGENEVIDRLNDHYEYLENLHAGKEKKAYEDARSVFYEKLIEVNNFEVELEICKYNAEHATDENEPGGTNE